MIQKKIILILITFIIGVFLFSPGDVSAQLTDSPWPMFHGNAKHTGLSPYDTSHVDGTVKWSFKTGAGIESSPVIGKDGTIYVGSHDSYLYAIKPNGKKKWRFKAGEPEYNKEWDVSKGILSTPAIDSKGTIYFTSFADKLYAVDSKGKKKWDFPVSVSVDTWSSPVIGSDGTIYIGSARIPTEKADFDLSGRLYAINPDGTEKWSFETQSDVNSNPAIGKDGTIYVGTYEGTGGRGNVHAINPDGTEKWKFSFEKWIESSPAIGKDGTIYAGTYTGKFFAINSDGTKKWSYQTGDGISSTAAVGKDGTIYVGSWDYYVYAFNPGGTVKWRFKTPKAFEGVCSSPAIGADGTIYVGSNSGYFYALNLNGTEKWSFGSKDSGMMASPAIGKDGTVYAASWNKKLYAFGGSPPVIDEGPKDVRDVKDKKETTGDIPIIRVIGILGVLVIALAISIFSVLRKRKLKK